MMAFKRHQQESHDPNSNVKCDICFKDFAAKRFLKIHKEIVHAAEEKWFICEICNAHFKWDASLRKHMRQKHPK